MWGALQAGTTVAAASNLFPRVEIAKEEAPEKPQKPKKEKKKAAPADAAPVTKTDAAPPANPEEPAFIDFTDFQKVDIRMGTVLVAERHPNADKLLRVEVDLGEEKPRQIVAGLAAYFEPEQLVGRQVAVVANLAPRKLRGLESQGMILAVRQGEGMELVAVSGPVDAGSKVS